MSSSITCLYSSCACNKSPRSLDWGCNNIICYGACNAIQFIEFEENKGGKSILTAVGHKKLITSIHWISKKNRGPENELVTTSADQTAIIWTFEKSECTPSHVLTGHSNVVKTASSIYVECKDEQCLLVATSSADSNIRIWERCSGQVICKQTISLGNGFALDLKLAALKEQDIILIVGSDDTNIHIYTQEKNSFHISVILRGHEDWIQSLDVMSNENDVLFLTSSSQDHYIRIWKISPESEAVVKENDMHLKVEETVFCSKGLSYSVSLESVLSGHENWIYSVKWRPIKNSKFKSQQILSASMDKTMIIWEPDTSSNMWLEKVRVGGVGGNTLGFYGGVFSPNGEIIVAHGFQGAIHIWEHNQELDCWQPGISFGGHVDEVKDIDWDPNGEFLLSCSSDQTTRLHSPFVNSSSESTWHEIARPQVHGYDMVCLSAIDRYKFVSAGDEKILRIFEAPRNFAETLENLCKLDVASYLKDALPEGASVPSLGLSNKAVFHEDLEKANSAQEIQQKHAKDYYPDYYYTPTVLKAPPTEETLVQNTLWPEIQKLYGHPYEVFTIATNHARTLVASTCKASKAEHAAIILWDTSTWRQVGQLVFHNLTVTQIEFSPDDEYLLSVSRDRMWAVYRHFPKESPPYRKVAHFDKKSNVHTRIIWSCSWTFDSLYFATASRDKKVAMWSKNIVTEPTIIEQEFSLCCKALEVQDSATAVSIAPCLTTNDRYIIAIGMENGCINLCTWCRSEDWKIVQRLDQNIAHHLNINRLKFSPVIGEAGCQKKTSDLLQLASCSNDHFVKIYRIVLSLI